MKIHILATKDRRPIILEKTVDYWEGHGWEVVIEWNDNQFPSYGRNRILRRFYDSNEKWLAMADNDTMLVDRLGQTNYFADNAEEVLNKLPSHVGTVVPMNPSTLRFGWTSKQDIYKTHWRFERDFVVTGKITFHQNTGQEFFQRTDLTAYEDCEWAFQQLKAGYLCSRLNNVVLREQDPNRSSLFRDHEHRLQAYAESKLRLTELYPELYIGTKGQFMRHKLIKQYLTPKMEKYMDIPYGVEIPPYQAPNVELNPKIFTVV